MFAAFNICRKTLLALSLPFWLILISTIYFVNCEWPQDCFLALRRKVLNRAQTTFFITEISLESCMTICLSRSKKCRSFTFEHTKQNCSLFETTKLKSPAYLSNSKSTDYYQRDGKCRRPRQEINVRKCPDKHLSYIRFNNHEIRSQDKGSFKEIKGASLRHCQQLCTNNTDSEGKSFRCLSIEYVGRSGQCVLLHQASKPFGSGRLTTSNQRSLSHYQKICVPSEESICTNALAFERVGQHVLLGHADKHIKNKTVAQCLAACVDSVSKYNIHCKSTLYYYGPRECILNKETRRTQPDMFLEEEHGDLVDYFDNHCKAEAQWGEWGDYSACSATCGAGTYSRRRKCSKPDACFSGAASEILICDTGKPCPAFDQDEGWGPWSTCSATCGKGTRQRKFCGAEQPAKKYKNGTANSHCKKTASAAYQTEPCEAHRCSKDGKRIRYVQQAFNWGPWTGWTACECSIGDQTGVRNRVRRCPQAFRCIGNSFATEDCRCFGGPGPVTPFPTFPPQILWQQWGPWSPCQAGGIRTRTRTCPQFNQCPGRPMETESCSRQSSAQWGQWAAWGPCTVSCGPGSQIRMRQCPSPNACQPSFSAAVIRSSITTETESKACFNNNCPVQLMQWGPWSVWSACTVTCGGGDRVRRRRCPVEFRCGDAVDTEIATCNTDPCGPLADWSLWGRWSICSVSCGPGTKTRIRTCLTPGTCGTGSPGPYITGGQFPGPGPGFQPGLGPTETMQCNDGPCPSWEQWDAWTPCSATCGGGQRSRVRICTLGFGLCGAADAQQSEICGTQPCPSWTNWGPWTPCTTTCGPGTRTRQRTCLAGPGRCFPGQPTESGQCNNADCPAWTPWGPWGPCTATCGQGTRSRTRSCQLGPGRCFPGQPTETGICQSGPCPDWSQWGPWGACSATCGPGTRARQRTCASGPGRCFPGQPTENVQCNVRPCPGWTQWGPWSTCSASCGPGSQTRQRTCQAGFNQCFPGQPTETRPCNNRQCPGWGQWGPWSRCSVTCGTGGQRTRMRRCDAGPGRCFPGQALEVAPCQGPQCQGQWSLWSQWSRCSTTCGPGTRTRMRVCSAGPGQCFPGQSRENGVCNNRDCPVLQWTQWGPWSRCTTTCGPGNQSRMRTCQAGPGRCFPGQPVQNQPCTIQPCQSLWSQWGPWTTCSTTCGPGNKSRNRICQGGPGRCRPGQPVDNMPCTIQPCQSFWSPWGPWGQCSATCGPGSRSRSRTCPDGPGRCFPGQSLENARCNIQPCQSFWSPWGPWGQCSATCGPGSRSRSRTCPDGPGRCFPGQSLENVQCNIQQCQSFWSPWGPWGQCSATCGPGSRSRSRTCPDGPGRCFPGQSLENVQCNIQPCQSFWSPWGPWGQCSATCGPGSRSRSRTCPDGPGRCSPGQSLENAPCTIQQCQALWAQWSEWVCTVTCGEGSEVRRRRCSGANCIGQGQETRRCTAPPCVQSGWAPWGPWSRCSTNCGEGTRMRARKCVTFYLACIGDSREQEPCRNPACPGPNWLPWGPWSQCSASCGGGRKTRRRQCSQPRACGPGGTDSDDCNIQACGNGIWQQWGAWSSCTKSCGSEGLHFRRRACSVYNGCAGYNSQSESEPCNKVQCLENRDLN